MMKRGRTGYQCPEEGCEFFCDDRDSFIAHAKSPELKIAEKKVSALVSTTTEIVDRLKTAIHDNLDIHMHNNIPWKMRLAIGPIREVKMDVAHMDTICSTPRHNWTIPSVRTDSN